MAEFTGIAIQTVAQGEDVAFTETQAKMHDLEKYMKELSEDMAELISDMTPEERTMTKSKLSTLVSKM